MKGIHVCMCSKNLSAVARISFISPSKRRIYVGTEVAVERISTCPCCKRIGSKKKMVGKSRNRTSVWSSLTWRLFHNWSDSNTGLGTFSCRTYSHVNFLLFPLLRIRLRRNDIVCLLRARRTCGKCFVAFSLPCLTWVAYLLRQIKVRPAARRWHDVERWC